MSEPITPERQREYHVGRSWSGTRIEDECPCQKEPCGLVRIDDANPACEHHPPERAKSMRQGHSPDRCPDPQTAREAAGRRLYDAEIVTAGEASHWRHLPREYRETWIRAATSPADPVAPGTDNDALEG